MSIFEGLAVRYMVRLIQDFHLSDFQAAAVPGNAGHESGGFTQLQEIHPTSGRGGLGHFQDTGPRRVAFEQWIARNADKGWTAASFEANYSFLFRELIGPERAALEALMKTTTLEEATEVFCDKFERPGVKNLDSRISWARKALAAFVAAGIDPATLQKPTESPTETISAPIRAPTSPMPPLFAFLTQHPEIIRLVLTVLQQKIPQAASPPASIVQPEPGKPVPTEPAPLTRPSVQLSAAVGGIGGILQALGVVGMPVGTEQTTAGILTTVIPIVTGLVGMTGGWGTVASIALKAVGAIASAVKK